jgi:hypothetical protein
MFEYSKSTYYHNDIREDTIVSTLFVTVELVERYELIKNQRDTPGPKLKCAR